MSLKCFIFLGLLQCCFDHMWLVGWFLLRLEPDAQYEI